MSIAALKKKAADFEQKKQLDKAIAAYREVLDAYDAGGEENIDVGLYNRVGDMLVRQGNVPDGVILYERAVDLYAEGGFFNNAIALCNKILRTSPGRSSVYYKLGKISAAKGFKADAKSNFLEYADRMQKSGQLEEAFRALKEFADLVPDQDDIRLMLAEQLTKASRNGEALEQLQLLYARYDGEGRAAEAEATAERMKAIDPHFVPKQSEGGAKSKGDDLVFIDLDAPSPRQSKMAMEAMREQPAAPAPAPPPPAPPAAPAPMPAMPEMIDLEPTSVQQEPASAEARPSVPMLGLEPTSFTPEPAVETGPMEPSKFAALDFGAIKEVPTEPRRPTEKGLALPGDLPMIDVSAMPASSTADLPMIDMSAPAEPVADLPMIEVETTANVELPMVEMGAPETTGSAIDFIDFGEPAAPPAARASAEMPMIDLGDELPIVETPSAEIPAEATEYGEIAADTLEEPPPVRRTQSLLNSAIGLVVKLEDEPENWALHRQYAEALLDDGDREGGLRELETALVGFEKDGDLDTAGQVADEIIRVNPASVRHHQKRVEYAFRANDKARLVEAYVALADALFREGQADKARVVYQRVLDIVPDDVRALAALEAFGPAAPAPRESRPPIVERSSGPRRTTRRYTGQMIEAQLAVPPEPEPEPAASKGGDDEFVSLGDWLREDDAPKNTRMVVDEEAPSGDEQADFDDMLRKFKQGVAENVEEEDHESHYDLGVAFKEMGLLDEAIAEFQKALRGATNRVRTFEALGQCFLEKKQLPVATTILSRALNEAGVGEDQLVGVLYLLGYIHESLGKYAEAKTYYERVFAVDIQFRDVGDRLNAVDKAAQ